MLVLMGGLQGVGKSTLADELGRRLPACVVSVDPIEAAMWRSGLPRSFETGLAAYEVGSTVAEHQLSLGLDVIADAANFLEAGRAIWKRAATATASPVRVIHVTCGDEDVHRQRVETRCRGIVGFEETTWAEVRQRVSESEPWLDDHLVVDTLRSLSDNIDLCLAYLR